MGIIASRTTKQLTWVVAITHMVTCPTSPLLNLSCDTWDASSMIKNMTDEFWMHQTTQLYDLRAKWQFRLFLTKCYPIIELILCRTIKTLTPVLTYKYIVLPVSGIYDTSHDSTNGIYIYTATSSFPVEYWSLSHNITVNMSHNYYSSGYTPDL